MKRTVRKQKRTTATKRGNKAFKKYEGEMDKTLYETFSLETPYHITLERKSGKGTKITMGLNWYRNANFYNQNAVKQLFTERMEEPLKPVKLPDKVSITYTLYTKDKRSCDVANVCCIIDKFFSDCLSYYKCIEDDDYRYLPQVVYQYGGIEEGNAKVIIDIEEFQSED